MKITCQACSAKYTIADDKVRGRKVKIRCKGCGTPIVVDGQKADSGQGLVGTPSMSDPPPAAESIPPPPQAPAIAEVWNVNLSDTDSRTMTVDEIIAGWSSGLVTSDAFVWKDGMADWVAILDCAEIAARLGTPAAAAPTGTPYGPPVVLAAQAAPQAAAPEPAAFPQVDAKAPAAAARLAGGRSNTADLFGGVDSAGSEQEVVMSSHSLPTAPGSTAYGDDKMTGARNENSVLFSLDSLKAGFAGGPAPAPSPGKPAPKAPSAARSGQTSNPDDPFGMGSSQGMVMASPGGNALFSLSDNNALLTAPAPPEPPPVVAVSSDLGGGSIAPSPAQKRKQMIMIGGIVAGVLIMGIVLGLSLGGDSDEAKNDGAASAKAGSELVKDKSEEEKKEEPKKEEPKPEEKKDEPKPEEKAADATKADPGKKVGGASGGAVKKEEKKEEPAPGPTADVPFSKASAISALSAAAAQASGCKKPGGPTGAGKVQVTFAPSGRVTTANITGPPFAGTAVGGCIAGAFRRAKVPPFAGTPVTVQKSFSVN